MKTKTRTTGERVTEMLESGVDTVYIASNGVWSALMKDGSSMYSYEKLDYHPGCREFLEGLRDAGVRIRCDEVIDFHCN